jgi:hypothetical protein
MEGPHAESRTAEEASRTRSLQHYEGADGGKNFNLIIDTHLHGTFLITYSSALFSRQAVNQAIRPASLRLFVLSAAATAAFFLSPVALLRSAPGPQPSLELSNARAYELLFAARPAFVGFRQRRTLVPRPAVDCLNAQHQNSSCACSAAGIVHNTLSQQNSEMYTVRPLSFPNR